MSSALPKRTLTSLASAVRKKPARPSRTLGSKTAGSISRAPSISGGSPSPSAQVGSLPVAIS